MNRLSGPGLEAKDFAGMMQGGGKWPGRWVPLSCFIYFRTLYLIVQNNCHASYLIDFALIFDMLSVTLL